MRLIEVIKRQDEVPEPFTTMCYLQVADTRPGLAAYPPEYLKTSLSYITDL